MTLICNNEVFVYKKCTSQDGATVSDIRYRQPTNLVDQKKELIIERLIEGKPVSFAEYNFNTARTDVCQWTCTIKFSRGIC